VLGVLESHPQLSPFFCHLLFLGSVIELNAAAVKNPLQRFLALNCQARSAYSEQFVTCR